MEKTVELQTLDEEILNRRRNASIAESKAPSDYDRDRLELARVGKQQVLKVGDWPQSEQDFGNPMLKTQ